MPPPQVVLAQNTFNLLHTGLRFPIPLHLDFESASPGGPFSFRSLSLDEI